MAPSVVYPSSYIFTEFITKYEKCLNFEFQNTNKQSFMLGMDTGNPRLTIERALRDGKGWNSERDVKVGMSKVFISEKVWTALEESLKEFNLRASVAGTDLYSQSQHRQHVRGSSMTLPGGSDMFDDAASYFSDADSHYESEYEFDNGSTRGSAAKIRNNKDDIESGGTTGMSVVATPSPILKKSAAPAPVKNSRSRRNWLCCVWFSTWWIPSIFLSCCGKMKRKDQQIAWREKVTLCLIIFLLCAFILFFIIGLGWVLCPPKFVLSAGQVGSFNSINSKPPLVYMYGTYYDMTSIINSHVNQNQVMTASAFEQTVLGQDVSQMFDKQAIWTASGGSSVCQYKKPNQFDLFSGKQIPTNWLDHERQLSPNNQNFFSQLSVKGTIVWDRPAMQQFLKNNPQGRLVVAYDKVYDISGFFTSGYTGQNFLGDTTQFQSSVTTIFTKYGSTPWNDATNDFQTLKNFDVNQFNKVMQCMNNMMYVGAVDHRNDLQCVIPNYILLLASAILVAVIGFKFLAALQLGSKRAPEYHEKFVICQVPCYTEGEVSLSRTLNSLALSDYDDKRKLIFVICDGMIIGTGNDRPTPRIVLDLLGVDPLADPDALSFQSLGEGNKQLNMGKVYSGLYEYEGRAVPFVVVVKVGTSSERNRPGNR